MAQLELPSFLLCHSVSYVCSCRACAAGCVATQPALLLPQLWQWLHNPHLYSVPFCYIKSKLCAWSTFKSCWRSQDLVRACSFCPIWHWTHMPELAMEKDKWETGLPYAAGRFPSLCFALRLQLCCFFTPPKLVFPHRWCGEQSTRVQRFLVPQRGTGSYLETWQCLTFSFKLFGSFFSFVSGAKGRSSGVREDEDDFFGFFLKTLYFPANFTFLGQTGFPVLWV